MPASKWVHDFEEGSKDMKDLLGGKGANLAEMTRLGFPVPPGFTISTEACRAYRQNPGQFPEGLMEQVGEALKRLEKKTSKGFGDARNPLLVSVRSGARDSMPGMMDTVLNLGLNNGTMRGLEALTGNRRFVLDARRRFIMMFSDIVLGLGREPFEKMFDELKERLGAKLDTEVGAEGLEELTRDYLAYVREKLGRDFPEDPREQMELALRAVFDSWDNKRARDYREFHRIPHDLGTAVNVQAMVFGNLGEDSGTGVAFTRNVATGEKKLYGEYLMNAQGEDVVAGVRTPIELSRLGQHQPELYRQFADLAERLERHYRDVMDIEFTVERGKLYLLQCRVGKRTARAAVRVAVEMTREGLIEQSAALLRIEPEQVNQALLPSFEEKERQQAVASGKLLGKGLNASPGSASGKAVFDADTAARLGKAEPVILVRPETNPNDVHGMLASRGILTARGGATSHAAVVARGLGLPCVAGCEQIWIDEEQRLLRSNGKEVREFEYISIDGTSGEVFSGSIPVATPSFEEAKELKELLGWADGVSRLEVWANADYPRDAARARQFGAKGIGLCRTEHMFMERERLPIVQQMILAGEPEERKKYLDQLLPVQRQDFLEIFRVMDGLPVVIRLIDPPLHEFLPSYDELLQEVCVLRASARSSPELEEKQSLLDRVEQMREMNPMLGLRGCRLGILRPEITAMQTRAILEAACEAKREGVKVLPKIMIPLVSHVNELRTVRQELENVARQVVQEQNMEIDYKFGTMIEIPRACLTADEIARCADFFSFGTNDLTQTTYGFSRDDAEGKFLLEYVQRGILPDNPFQTLDSTGVGRLMEMAVKEGRAANAGLEVGICGEHGGDPRSVVFCHEVGLDYVSCSPFRVPVARLAAAQAVLGGIAVAASR
jgi:pyruvate,orthophosphate dikinase